MQPAGLKEPFPHARHGGELPAVSMDQNYPLLLVESLTHGLSSGADRQGYPGGSAEGRGRDEG